jgi:hypothetical protein
LSAFPQAGPEVTSAVAECLPVLARGVCAILGNGDTQASSESAVAAFRFMRRATAVLAAEAQVALATEVAGWAALALGDPASPDATTRADPRKIAIACSVLLALRPEAAARVVPCARSVVAAALVPGDVAADQALGLIANHVSKAAATAEQRSDTFAASVLAAAVAATTERPQNQQQTGDESLRALLERGSMVVGAVARGLVGAGGAARRLPATTAAIDALHALVARGAFGGFGVVTQRDAADGAFGRATHAKSLAVSRQRFYNSQVARLLEGGSSYVMGW